MLVYAPENFNGAKLIGVFEDSSPEWHQARSNGIGGSEVGTVLGLNPWESAYALWAKRTGRIESDIKNNWAIRFGKAFEQPILDLWQEEHPEWEVFKTGTYQDEHCHYRLANPDALAKHRESGEWMILEVKTGRTTWEEVPQAYIAQVLHYMGILKVKRGLIISAAGMSWNEYEVPFNQGQIDAQNSAIARFWDSIQTDTKPAWDGSESTYNAVRMSYDSIDFSEVEVGQLGIDLQIAQAAVDQATNILTRLKSEVLDKMGNAKWATSTVEGEVFRVASRQMRAGNPSLIVKKG